MRTLFRFVFVFLCLAGAGAGYAQSLPFQKDIAAFMRQDSVQAPVKGSILFIGSSSFTLWKDVQEDFPGYRIINRGFGGSSLPHQVMYAGEIIFPYQPSQIVIYCGENDLSASPSITGDTVLQRFQKLFTLVRKRLPGVPVVYVSMKPSPSRAHLMPEMVKGNEKIKKFLAGKRKTAFVDVYSLMLTPEGKPREELFLQDRLHMNEEGYRIWQKAIEPHLLKL